MEFLEGIDLKQIIRSEVQLYPAERVNILRQVALGLAHAHKNGVIHRDVKPANIRILKDGTVKIMDFGIARLKSSQMTKVGTVLGSLDYMSPEQVEGKQVDHRCDIFGFGVVAYELLTKTLPFKGDNMPSTMHKILNADPPEIPIEITKDYAGIEKVIDMCLDKDPDARFKSCSAVVADLDKILARMHPDDPASQPAGQASPPNPNAQETMVISNEPQGADGETIVASRVWQSGERFQKIRASIQDKDQTKGTGQRRYVGRASAIGKPRAGATPSTSASTGKSQISVASTPWLAIGAVVLLVVAGAGYMLWGGGEGGSNDSGVVADVENFAATHLERATTHEEAGELVSAVNELQRILEVTPGHAEATTRLATLSARIDESFATHMDSARTSIGAGDLSEAHTALTAALALKPDETEATRLLAETNATLNAQDQATNQRERVAALVSQARGELQAGQPTRALATLQAASAINPNNAEVQRLIAQAETSANTGSQADAAYQRGVTALGRQDFQGAVRQLEEALRLNPNHANARRRLQEAQAELAKPRFGTLTINALPFGEAFVDGESLGTTPVRIDSIAVGVHEVRIVKDGYQTFTRSVTITEGQTENVVGQLTRQ